MPFCLEKRRAAARAHGEGRYGDSGLRGGGLDFEHPQHRQFARRFQMIDCVAEPGSQSVGLDLHGRQLRTQVRERRSERRPEMLKRADST